MRKQYHFRPSEQGLLAWDVDRLVELSAEFTPVEVPLSEIRELDENFWFIDQSYPPTCRNVALHAKLMNETDLQFPIILSQDGGVMDGMHRVCKALILGRETISAVRFKQDPEPDYVGVDPDDLPYEEAEQGGGD
jgi:hypothetical protein